MIILILFDNNFILIANIYLRIGVPSIIFYALFNKEKIKYTRSLDGKISLPNYCISAPERDFIFKIIFKVYL